MKSYFRITFFSVLTALMLSPSAHASLLLEPYIGYVSGKNEMGSSNSNFTGSELGARVGFSNMGFALGVDYDVAKYTDDSSPKADLTSNDLGVFVAYKFPILLRAYLTYVPSPELKSKTSVSDITFSSGNLTKLGVGFTGFPFININLEYIMATYGKGSVGGFTGDLPSKFKTTAYAISVSAPFNFF